MAQSTPAVGVLETPTAEAFSGTVVSEPATGPIAADPVSVPEPRLTQTSPRGAVPRAAAGTLGEPVLPKGPGKAVVLDGAWLFALNCWSPGTVPEAVVVVPP